MNKVVKYMLIAIGINIAAGLLLAAPFLFLTNQDWVVGWLVLSLLLGCLSLFIQFIVGIVFAVRENKKDIGKGMLLSIGVILLIGLSVCSNL
ncbi:MAG: hypothetical protein ICV51_11060 [Flavisolibacter sp.]|nr:hypothetical protein [Flavisolibacter sp.]